MAKIITLSTMLLILVACGKGATVTTPEIGAVGARGPAGERGPPGIDPTPVTAVQLCPNPTTYPNVFSEVAFCINGNLYATYSANGGFSTMIPPGTYSSNGINSSCVFTVTTNCGIIH